jgi:hypothetical protein
MTNRLAMFLVAGIALAIFAQISQANSQTSLGMVTNQTAETCPTNRDFLPNVGETCYTAWLSACPGDADLQFTFGVAGPPKPEGTVVFFAGDGGETAADGPAEQAVLTQYLNDGWQVVQIAWGPDKSPEDWEQTNVTNAPSILTAACRPATFLNWVRNGNSGVGNGIWGKTAVCAHRGTVQDQVRLRMLSRGTTRVQRQLRTAGDTLTTLCSTLVRFLATSSRAAR